MRKKGTDLLAVCCDRTSRNGSKLKQEKFRLDIRTKIFTISVAKHWNRLPRDMVNALHLETCKIRLDQAPSNPIEL